MKSERTPDFNPNCPFCRDRIKKNDKDDPIKSALVRALKGLKEDLENNGEIFKTDQKRIDIIQSALRLAEGKDGE